VNRVQLAEVQGDEQAAAAVVPHFIRMDHISRQHQQSARLERSRSRAMKLLQAPAQAKNQAGESMGVRLGPEAGRVIRFGQQKVAGIDLPSQDAEGDRGAGLGQERSFLGRREAKRAVRRVSRSHWRRCTHVTVHRGQGDTSNLRAGACYAFLDFSRPGD
jgi:hypothetical protein